MTAQLIDIQSPAPCACCGEASDQLTLYGNGRLYCPDCPPLNLLGSPAALRARRHFTGPSLPWHGLPAHNLIA